MFAQELTWPLGIHWELTDPTEKCLSFPVLHCISNSAFNTGIQRGQITTIPAEGWRHSHKKEKLVTFEEAEQYGGLSSLTPASRVSWQLAKTQCTSELQRYSDCDKGQSNAQPNRKDRDFLSHTFIPQLQIILNCYVPVQPKGKMMWYLTRSHTALGTVPLLMRQGQISAAPGKTHSVSLSASTALSQWTRSPALFWSYFQLGPCSFILLLLHTTAMMIGRFSSLFSHKLKCSIRPKAITGCFHSAHNPLSLLSQTIGCVEFKVTQVH